MGYCPNGIVTKGARRERAARRRACAARARHAGAGRWAGARLGVLGARGPRGTALRHGRLGGLGATYARRLSQVGALCTWLSSDSVFEPVFDSVLFLSH